MLNKYAKLVPRELKENIAWRLKNQEETSPARQQEELERCRADLFYFVNAYVWQYNPNSIGDGSTEIGPFVLWDFQEEALAYLFERIKQKGQRRSVALEKSREMGVSWLVLILFDWLSLFNVLGFPPKFLVISRSAEAVDQAGDSDCLFWKLDFIHEHLPDWMTGGIKRRKMGLLFPRTKGMITGQASTGRAGVGGRATAMLVDEYAQIKEDREVRQRTASTTGCRIFVSTHLGEDTEFMKICQEPEFDRLQIHWTQHPDKCKGLYRYIKDGNRIEVIDKSFQYPVEFNFCHTEEPAGGPHPGLRSPWYDAKSKEIGSPRGVAMDLDINPTGSVSQFANMLTVRDLIGTYCTEPYWEGDVQYDRDSGSPSEVALVQRGGGHVRLWIKPLPDGRAGWKTPPGLWGAGCDIGEGSGTTPSCLTITNAETGEKALEYVNRNLGAEDFATVVVALCRVFGEVKLAWEMQGPGERFGRKVIDLGYRNVFYRQNEQNAPWARDASDVPGWYPSRQNRDLLLGEYRAALYERHCLNRSEYALRELLKFRYDLRGSVEYGGAVTEDFSGAGVNHGDVVIADALSWKMCQMVCSPKKKAQKAKEPQTLSLAWRMNYADNQRAEEANWI